ncbi:24228_t:CDS:2 [Gigaspora margarita]|uniref:24228_t:CDS:1 n=1 Tax=Gigaspora margarita TaxID=4874 RepID=A0ABN7V1L8_GIGMA|nr:24228_t:CDS:2 [Gigaspora margarita]
MASNSSLIINQKRIFYGPNYWKFDPIYQTNAKLFIKDLLNLKAVQFTEGSKITHGFFYGNHPIQEVDIIATIIAFEIINGKKSKFIKYTPTIGYVDFQNDDKLITEPKFDRGTVIRVIGILKDYNGKREISNSYGRMWDMKDPNAEVLRWLEILTLKKEVYSRPFILPKQMTTINNVSDEVPPAISVEHESDESDPNTSISNSRIFERMKNFDNQSSPVTEEGFTSLITFYIYKNNLTRFSMVRIRQSPELNEFAKKVAINQYPCSKPNGQQVAALFNKALRMLVLEGFLNYADYNKISYRVDSLFVDTVKEWKIQM